MFTLDKAGRPKSGPTVTAIRDTVVLDDHLEPVKPGSGVIGKIARTGDIPIGYYNDPGRRPRSS